MAENIRDGAKVYANPSGTANKAAAIGYYSSLPAAGVAGVMGAGPLPLAGLLLSGAGAHITARAMTNPRFVSWLARSTELPVSALPQQLVVLKQIGQSDPEVADIADQLEQQAKQPQ